MKSDRKVVAAGLGNVIHNYEERYCKLRIRSIILRDSYYFPFTYAAETWTTTPPPKKKDERRLSFFERKVLRRIFGPICEGGQWRMR